jgi:hypothetical protein
MSSGENTTSSGWPVTCETTLAVEKSFLYEVVVHFAATVRVTWESPLRSAEFEHRLLDESQV